MQISKTFTFEAAHRLHLLPESHQCSNLHGHSYSVTVTIKQKSLDDCILHAVRNTQACSDKQRELISAEHNLEKSIGFVLDYGDLSVIKGYIDTKLDHKVLIAMPTEESLKIFFSSMKRIKEQKNLDSYEEVANLYGFSLRNLLKSDANIESFRSIEEMDLDLGDYSLLKAMNYISSNVCLLPVIQTTCEQMGVFLKEEFALLLEIYKIPKHCISVTISETPKTNAVIF